MVGALRSGVCSADLTPCADETVGITGKFAVYPMDVALTVQFLDRISTFACEPVALMNGDDHLLTKERDNVRSLVNFFPRQGVDDGLKIAGKQALSQILGVRVAEVQFKSLVPCF